MGFTFIHAADLHLDSPLAGLGLKDPDVADCFAKAGRKAFEALIAETIASKAAFLLLAGDLFDGDWRDVTTGLYFVRALAELDREGIPTFLVKGNHDADSQMSRGLTYPASVHVFPSNKAQSKDLEEHRVTLHGRSFSGRLVSEDFVRSYPARRDGWFNIGLLHTALDGARRGHQSYAPCSVADLGGFGYDYWALGHIHAAEIVSQDPWIVYPGNLQGRSVRETGAKGAMRVTVEDGRIVDVAPLILDAARWAHETLDIAGCEDEEAVLALIRRNLETLHTQAEGKPLALRLTLTGASPAHARLVARHEMITAEVRALGFGLAADFWVERLCLNSSLPPPQGAGLAEPDALDLAALLRATAEDPDLLPGLSEILASLREKLPRELQEDFDQEQGDVDRLATLARDLLTGAALAGNNLAGGEVA